jgi:hypothetical protein
MRRAVFAFMPALVFIASMAAPAAAGVAGIETELKAVLAKNPGARVVRNAGNPVPSGLFGLAEPSGTTDPESAARAFMSRHAALYSMDNPGIALQTRNILRIGYGYVVQFSTLYQGFEILGGGVSVTVDFRGRIKSVTTSLKPFSAVSLRPGINAADAFLAAVHGMDPDDRMITRAAGAADHVRLVILPLPKGPALAYEVVISKISDMTVWKRYVSAFTGRVLFTRPVVKNMNQAKAYDPTPGYSMANQPATVTLTDMKDMTHATDKTMAGVRVDVKNCAGSDAPRLIFIDSGTEFWGPVCDWVYKAQADPSGDFIYDPLDPSECPNITGSGNVDSNPALRACFEKNMRDEFAETHTFFHVNRIYNLFRSYGFTELKTNPILVGVNAKFPNFRDLFSGKNCGTDADAGAFRCTTNRYIPLDNAMFVTYEPGSVYELILGLDRDALVLGQGSYTDFSYDADVSYHEFTHSAIDALTGNIFIGFDSWGLSDEPGAISEGVSDYYAVSITGNPKLGPYVRRDDKTTSILKPDDCLRDLTVQVKCPEDMWGEVHHDGEVISNALWEIRSLYKTEFSTNDAFKLEKAIYESMASWTDAPYFSVMAEAVLQSLTTSPDIGAAFAAKARLKFEANNATACPRYQKLTSGEEKFLQFLEGSDGSMPIPGYLQFAYDVPSDATGLHVSFTVNPQSNTSPYVRVMFRSDNRIEFTYDGDYAVYDYWLDIGGDNTYSIQIPELIPGKTYYLAVTNDGGTAILTHIKVWHTTDPVVVDGGTDDASVEDGGDSGTGVDDAGDGADPDAAVADGGSPADGPALNDGSSEGDGAVEEDGGVPGKLPGCSCNSIGV